MPGRSRPMAESANHRFTRLPLARTRGAGKRGRPGNHAGGGWLMRVAAAAAPKPLSIFTTTTPAAQVLSMPRSAARPPRLVRSEEHTSELQSRVDLVCRLLLEK